MRKRKRIKKKDIKPRCIQSTTVLEAVDRSKSVSTKECLHFPFYIAQPK